MLDDAYYFVREGLTTDRRSRVPHRESLLFDFEFCREYAAAALQSEFCVIEAFVLGQALAGVATEGDALDIGCGPGVLLGELARARPEFKIKGVDVSPPMLALARQHLAVKNIGNVHLMVGDMSELRQLLPNRRFDWITWTFGLHYCASAEQAVSMFDTVAQLLKPGGVFFLADLVRFKREDTLRWFSEKYDRSQGARFYREIVASYRASFSPSEVRVLLKRSRLPGVIIETSPAFPVLLLAYNRRPGGASPGRMALAPRHRAKCAILRWAFELTSVRSPA